MRPIRSFHLGLAGVFQPELPNGQKGGWGVSPLAYLDKTAPWPKDGQERPALGSVRVRSRQGLAARLHGAGGAGAEAAPERGARRSADSPSPAREAADVAPS